MVDTLLSVIQSTLLDTFFLEYDASWTVELDSSTPGNPLFYLPFSFICAVQSLHCCWNFTSPIVCFQFSILLSILWNQLSCGGPACWTLTTFSWSENVLDSTVGCQICCRRKMFTYCLCALFKVEIGLKGFGG